MMDIGQLGRYGQYVFEDGERVTGWLYGELPEGLLLSMDQDGNDIRFFKKRWVSWGSSEGPEASFSVPKDANERLWELNQSIRPAFESAFRRLDFKPFQRFQTKSGKLAEKIRDLERSFSERRPSFPDDEHRELKLLEQAIYPTDEVLELHSDVFDELERADILDIATEAGDKLPKIPPRYLLPLVDAANVGNDVDNDFRNWSEKRWNIEHHRSLIDEVSEQRSDIMFRGMKKVRAKASKKEKTSKRGGDRIRYASAILRVLSGTGLVTANIGVGLTGGLMSALITIGTTTIPTAVGVIASVGTGLSQVSDGLEKVGMLQCEVSSA